MKKILKLYLISFFIIFGINSFVYASNIEILSEDNLTKLSARRTI